MWRERCTIDVTHPRDTTRLTCCAVQEVTRRWHLSHAFRGNKKQSAWELSTGNGEATVENWYNMYNKMIMITYWVLKKPYQFKTIQLCVKFLIILLRELLFCSILVTNSLFDLWSDLVSCFLANPTNSQSPVNTLGISTESDHVPRSRRKI